MQLQRYNISICLPITDVLNIPSLSSGVLQPIHVLLFLVKAASPPILEATTVLVRVWSPSKTVKFNIINRLLTHSKTIYRCEILLVNIRI